MTLYGDQQVFLYCYDESAAKKGADDVCSLLYDFITEHVSQDITELHLFCDGCAGQNKNWTVLRFCHYLVHHEKRFESIKITFPIRGHSYMECDRDILVLSKVHQPRFRLSGMKCSANHAFIRHLTMSLRCNKRSSSAMVNF